jgi:hypothetical protein
MKLDRRISIPLTLLTLTLTLAPAATASTATEKGGWSLRLAALYNRPDSATQSGGASQAFRLEGDFAGAAGLAVAAERRLTRRLGVELGVSRSDPSFSLRGIPQVAQVPAFDAESDVGTWIATLGLDVHLTPERGFDLWVAPLLGWVRTESFTLGIEELATEARFGSGDDVAYGAQVGAVIPVSHRSGVYSSLTLLDADLDVADRDDPDGPGLQAAYDPLLFAVGFSTRF